MSVTTKAQESFTNLRKRLDQLGYQHPLGIESLPLVERLFADLLHTTESLRNVKVSDRWDMFIRPKYKYFDSTHAITFYV